MEIRGQRRGLRPVEVPAPASHASSPSVHTIRRRSSGYLVLSSNHVSISRFTQGELAATGEARRMKCSDVRKACSMKRPKHRIRRQFCLVSKHLDRAYSVERLRKPVQGRLQSRREERVGAMAVGQERFVLHHSTGPESAGQNQRAAPPRPPCGSGESGGLTGRPQGRRPRRRRRPEGLGPRRHRG